jgi:DNA-binding response OmpR family regulator
MSKKVLIVDDDQSNRMLLVLALKSSSYDLYEADSGSAADDLLQTQKFDIAIIDIELPDTNGLTVVEQLQGSSMTLMISSATDDDSVMEQACQYGVSVYLVKPFDLKAVVNLIQQVEQNPQSDTMFVLKNHTGVRRYSCV